MLYQIRLIYPVFDSWWTSDCSSSFIFLKHDHFNWHIWTYMWCEVRGEWKVEYFFMDSKPWNFSLTCNPCTISKKCNKSKIDFRLRITIPWDIIHIFDLKIIYILLSFHLKNIYFLLSDNKNYLMSTEQFKIHNNSCVYMLQCIYVRSKESFR